MAEDFPPEKGWGRMKVEGYLRQKLIYIIIGVGIIALGTINFLNWLFLQGVKSDLSVALSDHILTLGKVSARLLNGNDLEKIYPGMENSPTVIFYQQLLYDLKINSDLENIIVVDPLGHLLVDHRLNFRIGDSLLTFPLQKSMLQKAIVGEIPPPLLVKAGDQYFLTAYIPVVNDFDEPAAVLIIDVPFRFFNSLVRFERGSIYLGLAGLIILIIFSLIIISATRRLFRIQSRMQEQERLAQLGQMAASVAHEIRNPLSIMKGTAEILKKKYDNTSDEIFSYIPDEIERLNRLVDDFLRFARQRVLDIGTVDLREFLLDFSREFHHKPIHFSIPESPLHLKADRNALRQIILNLLQNALDAIGEDGTIRITTFAESHRRQRVIIEVTDNGKGIPPGDLQQVFEPFFSTKASGSGLGLAICRQLMEQMAGTIEIESRPGAGTTVRLKLPLT